MRFLNNISSHAKLIGIFLLIVISHILLKSYLLDYSGFWYDETFGLFFSQQDWGLIKHTSEWDLNPPFYYYFLWIWRNLFGISEFAIRFSSVIFSALAAGMIYIFSIKHFNKTTAFIALIIYTSSNEIFFYAHEARCYSILFFLTLCSSYFYFNLLNKKSISSTIWLGLINFILIYTHYLTGLILVFQVILMLVFYNKEFAKQVAIAFLLTFLLSFWRFTKKTILLIFDHKKSFSFNKATFYDLKETTYDFFNGKEIFFAYLILIIILSIILLFNKKNAPINIKPIYLILCSAGVIIICFVIGTITPIFRKRYVVYAIPFICILIGYIASQITAKKLKHITTSVICIISLYSYSKIDFCTNKEMNYRDAMIYIKKEKTPETAVLIETIDMRDLFNYYYNKSIFSDLKNMNEKMKKNSLFLISGSEDLNNIDLTKYNKIILTQTFVKQGAENDSLIKTISNHYRNKIINRNYKGVDILVFSN